MTKTLLAYDVEFNDGQKYRKHEWHEDYHSANRRIKYLLKLNKDKHRVIKYKKFVTHTTQLEKI